MIHGEGSDADSIRETKWPPGGTIEIKLNCDDRIIEYYLKESGSERRLLVAQAIVIYPFLQDERFILLLYGCAYENVCQTFKIVPCDFF